MRPQSASLAALLLLVATPFAGAVELESCTLYGASGTTRVEAECATLDRPLDPTGQDDTTIELRIAVVRSLAPDPARDALTLVNGGPGGSSIELYADLAPLLTGVLRERDIVIVDQRGTGSSTPLRCAELDAAQTTEDDPAFVRQAAERCLEQLPADPRYFTTSVAVADLDAVRDALGYDQWTLYGVSYGTRVVQHYARQHPQQTRALIIDGVVPMPDALGPNVAINAQHTLEAIFGRCRADQDCAAAFPELEADFARLGTELKRQARTIQLAHPVTGKAETLELTYGHLAVALRLGSYAPESASLIPLQIHQAANVGNFTPVAAQALRVIDQLTSTMAYGMHNAVVCTEDVPYFDFDPVAMREQLAATYLGPEQVDALQAICAVWPAGVIDPGFKAPLESAVPTLLLSGEFDPITPPANAEAVLPGLSNARHLVAPGQGHGVIARGCVPRLLREFIEAADPAALDAECLERLTPDPFFVDLMGPPR
ncbi:MAG: alpha/beta hydrolase [Pseudomonadota bacterium]